MTDVNSCLECDVCNEPFGAEGAYVPQLLECGHTVCQSCVRELTQMSNIQCPFDRKLTHASGLKRNFAFIELLSKYQQLNERASEKGLAILASLIANYERQKDEQKAQLEEKERDIHTKQVDIENLKTSNQSLGVQLAESHKNIDTANTKIGALETSLRKTNIFYTEKVAGLEDHIQTLKGDIVKLNHSWSNLLDYKYHKGVIPSTAHATKTEAEIAFDQATYRLNRKSIEQQWVEATRKPYRPHTVRSVVIKYMGQVVPRSDVAVSIQLGNGCHGDVYFGMWNRTPVAVKDLRCYFDSKKKINRFVGELQKLCHLNHANVLKYFSVFTEESHIGIITEYAQMSLYEALHINQTIKFSENDRLQLIRQICNGLEYLHGGSIAHCNLKPNNVLLDVVKDKTVVKLSDFGMSLVQDVKTSTAELVRTVSVSRFSAPELLNGQLLLVSDMMRADVYSTSLLVYNIVYEKEPFYELTLHQLQKEVGQSGTTPEILGNICLEGVVLETMRSAWYHVSGDRPTIPQLNKVFQRSNTIYVH